MNHDASSPELAYKRAFISRFILTKYKVPLTLSLTSLTAKWFHHYVSSYFRSFYCPLAFSPLALRFLDKTKTCPFFPRTTRPIYPHLINSTEMIGEEWKSWGIRKATVPCSSRPRTGNLIVDYVLEAPKDRSNMKSIQLPAWITNWSVGLFNVPFLFDGSKLTSLLFTHIVRPKHERSAYSFFLDAKLSIKLAGGVFGLWLWSSSGPIYGTGWLGLPLATGSTWIWMRPKSAHYFRHKWGSSCTL